MLKIFNLKNNPEYIEEVATLTQKEWGEKSLSKEKFELKVKAKISKIKSHFKIPNYCKLILLDDDILIGFISIFSFRRRRKARFNAMVCNNVC